MFQISLSDITATILFCSVQESSISFFIFPFNMHLLLLLANTIILVARPHTLFPICSPPPRFAYLINQNNWIAPYINCDFFLHCDQLGVQWTLSTVQYPSWNVIYDTVEFTYRIFNSIGKLLNKIMIIQFWFELKTIIFFSAEFHLHSRFHLPQLNCYSIFFSFDRSLLIWIASGGKFARNIFNRLLFSIFFGPLLTRLSALWAIISDLPK